MHNPQGQDVVPVIATFPGRAIQAQHPIRWNGQPTHDQVSQLSGVEFKPSKKAL